MVRGFLFLIAIVFSLLIIRDLDIICIAILKAETDSPLIVNGNGKLTFSVFFKA